MRKYINCAVAAPSTVKMAVDGDVVLVTGASSGQMESKISTHGFNLFELITFKFS